MHRHRFALLLNMSAYPESPSKLRRLFCAVRDLLILLSVLTPFAPALADTLNWSQLPPLPDPIGVAAPFAGVTRGALVVAGGANFPGKMPWEGGTKVWHDNVWLLEDPHGTWREIGKLPRTLAYGISVTTKDCVVCVGGSDSVRHYAETFRLRWEDGLIQIETLPPLPIPLSGASGALVGETLYVACGAEEPGEKVATNRAFAMDPAAERPEWRELPPLPGKARILAAGAAYNGAFYVMGGAALTPIAGGKVSREYLQDAWRYQPRTGWMRMKDLPSPSVAAPSPAPVIDGHILLIAGDDGSRVGFQPIPEHPGFRKTILSYDAAEDRWNAAAETPAPRATVPCVEWLGRYVIPSGEVRPGVRSPDVWSLGK